MHRYFPIDLDPPINPAKDTGNLARHIYFRRRYLDSLGRVYPQLYNPAYFKYLVDHEVKVPSKPFVYTTREIKISSSQYDSLVKLINESGYWTFPYKIKCDDPTFDGYYFSLEANTPYRYNIVGANSCGTDTGKFSPACQALVKAAGMDNEIQLSWKEVKMDSVYPKLPSIVQDVKIEEVKNPVKHKHKNAH